MQADIDCAIDEIATLESAFSSSYCYIGEGVLWECLSDPSYDVLLRRFLNTIENAGRSLDDNDAASARCAIESRTRILAHISSTLEKRGTKGSSEGLHRRYRAHFTHSVQACLFLVDKLPTIRKEYFATHRRQVSGRCDRPMHQFACPAHRISHFLKDHDDYLSMKSLCVLASSYMHLITLVAGKSSVCDASSRSHELSFEDAVEICKEVCRETAGLCLAEASSSSVVFESLLDRLRISEDSLVASAILEILSVIALRRRSGLTEKAIEASFTSLHTVYVNAGEYSQPSEPPYAFISAMKSFCAKATSRTLHSLQGVLEATIMRSCGDIGSQSKSFALYRYGILRHFGLLAHSSKQYSHLEKQLPPMIGELESLLKVLGAGTKNVCKATSTIACIPSLNAGTFAEYFELMLHLNIGASVMFSPDKGPSDSAACGPYRHFSSLLRLFRRLIRLYQDQCAVFPRKAGSIVFHASRHMLSVATLQLHRCVDWRNTQPLPSLDDKKAGVYDPGAVEYIQELLDVMAASAAATVLDLCDSWQEQKVASQNMSKITNLQYCAEKALRSIKDVASSHNLRHPNLDMPEAATQNETTTRKIAGFHQMEKSQDGKKRRIALDSSARSRSVESERPTKRRISPTNEDEQDFEWDIDSSDDDRSSTGSFGVAGNWGNASDEESSSGSLNLELKVSGL